MKKILIYGDSNLWSFNHKENKRLEEKYRWGNMLQDYLKNEYEIIQEGLPGRIAGNCDELKKYKNGKDTFEAIFRTQAPIDIIIIALGTNDLQTMYSRNHNEIYNDLMWYKALVNNIFEDPIYKVRFFNNCCLPRFIYVLPANFDYQKDAKNLYNENSEKERLLLIEKFKHEYVGDYVILNDIELADGDGLHYTIGGQRKVFEIVKEII